MLFLQQPTFLLSGKGTFCYHCKSHQAGTKFQSKNMRKIIVLSMVTLDGVMQAPGGPQEDTSGGFEYGGWSAPFNDEVSGSIMARLLQPADYLLGRKTFEIWETYWPQHGDFWPGINDGTKYVFSTTRKSSDWEKTVFIETLDDLKKVKASEGSDIQVWGSSELVQLLFKNDLVDELWLIIHPVILGSGKKLFTSGAIPAAFTLVEGVVTPCGLIIGHYKRAGVVKTGTAGA
jgi:dihydrofolate reductase